MNRDMDLIRKILLRIEEYPDYDPTYFKQNENISFNFEGHSTNEIEYHLKLLADAGFTESGGGKYGYRNVVGLTWNGHEFLELMKGDTTWNNAKDAMKKTGGMAFEVLLKVLIETATKAALGQLH